MNLFFSIQENICIILVIELKKWKKLIILKLIMLGIVLYYLPISSGSSCMEMLSNQKFFTSNMRRID